MYLQVTKITKPLFRGQFAANLHPVYEVNQNCFEVNFSHLKTVDFDINQFTFSLAMNLVKEKDKKSILVHIFKQSKLSQKTQ